MSNSSDSKYSSCAMCTDLGYFTVFSKKPIKVKKKNQFYDLGNGIICNSEEGAYQILLKRDFPDFNFEDGEQKRVLVTPPHFMYQRKDLPESGTPERKKVLESLPSGGQSNLAGEDFEAHLFYSMKNLLENSLKATNVALIQGWKRTWTILKPKPHTGKGDEHDLIILDGTNKLIILFEAKRSINSPVTLNKAKLQLSEQVKFFNTYHGHVLSTEWRIATIVAHNDPVVMKPCCKCKPFYISGAMLSNPSEVLEWWKMIAKKPNRVVSSDPKNSYQKLIGRIIGMSTCCPIFVSTMGKYRTNIKEAITGDKAPISVCNPQENRKKGNNYPSTRDVVGDERIKFFMNADQRELISSSDNKRILLHGGFGTGKSLILKLKALEMARNGEKVLFVVGSTLAQDFAKYFFDLTLKDFQSKEIEVIMPKENINEQILLKLIDGYHIFWDEFISQLLGDLDSKLFDDKYSGHFWIVVTYNSTIWNNVHDEPIPTHKSFKTLKFNFCLRNKQEVQKFVDVYCTFTKKKHSTSLYYEGLSAVKNDLAVLILHKDNLGLAILTALESYTNDCVVYINAVGDPKRELITSIVNGCKGWKVVSWKDYLAKNVMDGESSFIFLENPGFAGLEAKNVIVNMDTWKGLHSKDLHMCNTHSNGMLRAVVHLTVIQNLKCTDQDALELKENVGKACVLKDLINCDQISGQSNNNVRTDEIKPQMKKGANGKDKKSNKKTKK